MKKLLFVFATFFSMALVGCGAQDNNVTRFDTEGNPTSTPEATPEQETEVQVPEAPAEAPALTDPKTQATPPETPKVETPAKTEPPVQKEENKAEPEVTPPVEPKPVDEKKQEKVIPPTPKEDKKVTSEPISVNAGKLALTNVKDGKLDTKTSYNLIKGTTPKNTYSLMINGYKLKKYTPGQTNWNYIASTKLKTLNKGENKYEVKAMDKAGKEIDNLNFTITYGENDGHTLPSVGPNLWLTFILTLSILAGYKLTARTNKL